MLEYFGQKCPTNEQMDGHFWDSSSTVTETSNMLIALDSNSVLNVAGAACLEKLLIIKNCNLEHF